MARIRGIIIVLVLIGAGIYGYGRSQRLDFCGELYGFYSSTGEPAERASKMVIEIRRLSSLEKSPTLAAFGDVLDVVRDEARYGYSAARAQAMVDAMKRTWEPFRQTVIGRCKSIPYAWTSNFDAMVKDIVTRQKDHERDLQAYREALEKRERVGKTASCQNALATWAAARTPVALSPMHYSRTGGIRAGTAFLEQKDGRWQAQVELAAGDVNATSQIDGIVAEPSPQCITLKSNAGATQKICGLRATVVTCQVSSGQLLGQATFTLPPPSSLSVNRGSSVQDAARLQLERQARTTATLRWMGVVAASAGVRRPVTIRRPR